jgi:chromosomal replication initiation ATPase DnaA
MGPPLQLALALPHAESFAREDFLAGPSNQAALALIERWPDWPARAVALVGPKGAGKSHLAAIWANNAGARFLSGRALAMAALPGALATGALVIEDLADDEFEERPLFHLLNLAQEHEAYVLITTRTTLAGWASKLPDLASRLRAIPAVTVSAPDDALLRAVLVKLFADRQLKVDEAVVAYLATRLDRSLAAARAAVDRLDRAALRRKRRVTRALAADLFRERDLFRDQEQDGRG